MTYNPTHQYRCTIIRGKSQSDLEDLLPFYAQMVHKYCPCTEDAFKKGCRNELSKALFQTSAYDILSDANKKTVDNHLTEIAGTLLGLYFPVEEPNDAYVYESEACKFLVENNDFPTFFKNLCLNFQFPNGAKWKQFVQEDLDHKIKLKPFCFVVALLYYAQQQPHKQLLSKQEIGYYVLNNLDVLQGLVEPKEVYERIMSDRANGIKREKLSGSKDWQHIKEQFNLLELSNVIEGDATYIWLNKEETEAVALFLKNRKNFGFDPYAFSLTDKVSWDDYFATWKAYYGTFHKELLGINTAADTSVVIVGREEQKAGKVAIKSTTDLGDAGEALVFRLEQERVRSFKERLVNKVLLLGKTKGLGYDILSLEANEMPSNPEMARMIEVKATKRITEPSFDSNWLDSLNITSKEWVAAQQYGEYYNIYRVYFTKTRTIIIRIQNPYKKAQNDEIEVYPTIYQMNFGSAVVEQRYAE